MYTQFALLGDVKVTFRLPPENRNLNPSGRRDKQSATRDDTATSPTVQCCVLSKSESCRRNLYDIIFMEF
jgi:hypothetical protein